MPQLFEVFGYPLGDNSAEAQFARLRAYCPFMMAQCDGGGNRYLSHVHLTKDHPLAHLFPRRPSVPAAVCSIQVKQGEPPWIVCPRRLLTLGRGDPLQRDGGGLLQGDLRKLVFRALGFGAPTRIGVWPEVRLEYEGLHGERRKSFDYTFDYVLAPVGAVHLPQAAARLGMTDEQFQRHLRTSNYRILHDEGGWAVRDYPAGAPNIVEIMTSSTSGGNKADRSTVPLAFEDALLGRPHRAPGINYRQVWSRMVSQLIVKSEVALSWGGLALWMVQDVLVDYICSSTGLDIHAFLSAETSEVNMVSASYLNSFKSTVGPIDLPGRQLYAGPISARRDRHDSQPAFQDMIRAPICPPLTRLLAVLAKRCPSEVLDVSQQPV
jgi:hypothetical protein